MAAAGAKVKAKRWRYAMVCSSNMNRSMEAHSLLARAGGLHVASYGTGAHVKLPGPSLHEPNVYAFGTPYRTIHDDLRRKDPDLYRRNGLLPMLKRNSTVKASPQRWQDNAGDGPFDVVLTFEEKVFDSVVEDLNSCEQRLINTVLIINMDVKDNHEEAGVGAKLALDLCQSLKRSMLGKTPLIISLLRLRSNTSGRPYTVFHSNEHSRQQYQTKEILAFSITNPAPAIEN